MSRVNVRFLGHSAVALEHEGTTVLIDPFLTGNPKARRERRRGRRRHDPADARPRRPHRRHRRDRARAPARPSPRSSSWPASSPATSTTATTCATRTSAARSSSTGAGRAGCPAWHTSTTPEGHDQHARRASSSNIGGKTIYHLGDTALFSDLALPGRRDELDLALVPIGGHYTMDRFDARRRRRAARRAADRPDPLRHLPADRDRRAGVRRRRRGHRAARASSVLEPGADTGAQVITAVVLIEADRDVMSELGGQLADVAGVAEAYSVTGEWDFVCIVRVPRHEQLADVISGHDRASCPASTRTQTLVAFEAFSKHDLEALFDVGNAAAASPVPERRRRAAPVKPEFRPDAARAARPAPAPARARRDAVVLALARARSWSSLLVVLGRSGGERRPRCCRPRASRSTSCTTPAGSSARRRRPGDSLLLHTPASDRDPERSRSGRSRCRPYTGDPAGVEPIVASGADRADAPRRSRTSSCARRGATRDQPAARLPDPVPDAGRRAHRPTGAGRCCSRTSRACATARTSRCSSARSPTIPNVDAVGSNGPLKQPYRSFRFGTERP